MSLFPHSGRRRAPKPPPPAIFERVYLMRFGDVPDKLEAAIKNRRFVAGKRFAVALLNDQIELIPTMKVEPGTKVFGHVTEQDCAEGLKADHWALLIAHILIYLKRSGKCQKTTRTPGEKRLYP